MDKKRIFARNLRNNLTPQEQKLWNILKNRQFHNLPFRRQYIIGNYIVDFVCRHLKLVIELDGGQHNLNDNILYDNERSKFLEKLGYRVIRFWNNDIDENIGGVYETLEQAISPHPNPPPKGRE